MTKHACILGSLALLGACSFGSASADLKGDGQLHDPNAPGLPGVPEPGGGPGDPPALPPPEEPPPPRCDVGRSYQGFAGTVLEVGRVDQDLGVDVGRLKPFSALSTEYARVLGNSPGLVSQMASTFGSDPARWYSEPQANAVSVYSAYRIAFQGCLSVTSGQSAPAKYQSLPSLSTAADECSTWARRFWSRTATSAEVEACVKVAMVESVNELDPSTNTSKPTTAPRRWAYTCASVLTAAGFLTY